MSLNIVSTVLFGCAILHTFLASKLTHISHQKPKDSFSRAALHLLGEVEVVFGFWAALFIAYMAASEEPRVAIEYVEKLKFTEPLFVFVVMVICATRPVLHTARQLMVFLSSVIQKIFKLPAVLVDVFVLAGIGPLLGSFITEPAAMTVVALLLFSMIEKLQDRTLYALLAILFVNVSVGGAMTPFAAPPILMVAHKWGWDIQYTLMNFAWKSFAICFLNALILVLFFKNDLKSGMKPLKEIQNVTPSSIWIQFVHLFFLILIVLTNHYPNVFMGLFLFFTGVTAATKRYQEPLRLRESLLVGFFLAGLMVFGEFQQWWLQPLLQQLSDALLFFGATGLTAVTDNAALTYLGSQVPSLGDTSKYALVAGALAGGGLTVLANAPNPAGYSILVRKFPEGIVNHFKLLIAALIPTIVAIIFFWII